MRPLMLAMTLSMGWTATALARPECDEIRDVRALARAAGLDETTLVALERTHCQPSSPTCGDLTTLSALGRAGQLAPGDQRLVDRERDARCAGGGGDDEDWSWSNGRPARTHGTWSYPTGSRARGADGRWDYPNGAVARRVQGRWQYPDGSVARSKEGQWSEPRGAATTFDGLVTFVCTGDDAACSATKARLAAADETARDAVLLAAVWAKASGAPAAAAAPPPPPPVDKAACLDWASAQFNKSYNAGAARDEARKLCGSLGDLETAKLLYGWFAESYPAADAMRAAAAAATAELAGRREVLAYAYQAYHATYPAADAAKTAIAKVKAAPGATVKCLRPELEVYKQSLPSADAMNKAFTVCP